MKFLLNVNTPRVLGRRLLAEGHACRHAADVGLGRAPDEAIVREARAISIEDAVLRIRPLPIVRGD